MSSRLSIVAVALAAAVGSAAAQPGPPPAPPPDLTRANPHQGAVEAIAVALRVPTAAELEAALAPTVRVHKRVACRGLPAVVRGRQRAKLAACLRAKATAGVAITAVRGQRRVRAHLALGAAGAAAALIVELRPAGGRLEIVGLDGAAPARGR